MSRLPSVTETLPPLVAAVRAGVEPAASRALADLRVVWAPALSRLRSRLGGGIPDFDQEMDIVLVRACRRCDPSNLICNWWRAVLRNAAIDLYAKGSAQRASEFLTSGGSVPEFMDTRANTEAMYLALEDSHELRTAISALPKPERLAVELRLRGSRVKNSDTDRRALGMLRAWLDAC